MLTALILISAVAGILVLARRWPDVEAKLWPDEVDVPESAAKRPDESVTPAEIWGDKPDEAPSEQTAGGLMQKKMLGGEPDVVPTTTAVPKSLQDDEDEQPEPTVPEAKPSAKPAEPSAEAATPTRAAPAPRVMGEPARPSQPAYVDATKRVSESFEQLSSEADRAWQDRNYDKAEQACLKILVQQPKNHKYMTRIGQIYQETGELADAKEAYESAKKLDPKNFFVLNRLSEVERMISDKGGRSKLKKALAGKK